MRFFLFFYEWGDQVQRGRGFDLFTSRDFPSCQDGLLAKAKKVGVAIDSIVMTGLFEFETERDFDSFREGL